MKKKVKWIVFLTIPLLTIGLLLFSRGGRIVAKELRYRTIGKAEINRYIEALGSPTPKGTDRVVFKDAVERLVRIGNPAIPALIETLVKEENEPHPSKEERGEYTKGYLIWILGKIGNKRATPTLIEALKDEHPLVRRFAAGALGDLKDQKAVPDLIKTRRDEDEYVRIYAAWALREIGEEGRGETEKRGTGETEIR